MRRLFFSMGLLGCLVAVDSAAQSGRQAREEAELEIFRGNELYKRKEYQAAENAYATVLEKYPQDETAKYNRAASQYRQAKPDESIKTLEDLAFRSEKGEMKAKAYYSKGAILSSQGKLEESIEAYKNALRKNPADKEARENLQKALLEQKKKTPQKKDEPKKQQQQKSQQKPQPRMNQNEAEKRLRLLEQKEKEVQERLLKGKSKTGGDQSRDW